jgi:hypothetical protein
VGAVVLAVGRLRYRGQGSGLEAEDTVGYMLKFRRGRLLLIRAFREPEAVLEAVGR